MPEIGMLFRVLQQAIVQGGRLLSGRREESVPESLVVWVLAACGGVVLVEVPAGVDAVVATAGPIS
ncbi:hypothetical protein [Nonomuraea mesophila]|uniref:hypothetical protein n=1 Tax=Nonomuraea mesophila TaxID=2530382 RepID=UPI00140D97C4|nr:hypothetical protein [Nonomuraea mesophila]